MLPGKRPFLRLSVQSGASVKPPTISRARLRRWILTVLSQPATLTLRYVGRREGRSLNLAHRGRDYATNVLTFGYGEVEALGLAADIVLCLPVIREEARHQGKPFEYHLAHLVIHGVLHAAGHDHEVATEADLMESLERRALARLRMPDPYGP